jgi:hypothetical protein
MYFKKIYIFPLKHLVNLFLTWYIMISLGTLYQIYVRKTVASSLSFTVDLDDLKVGDQSDVLRSAVPALCQSTYWSPSPVPAQPERSVRWILSCRRSLALSQLTDRGHPLHGTIHHRTCNAVELSDTPLAYWERYVQTSSSSDASPYESESEVKTERTPGVDISSPTLIEAGLKLLKQIKNQSLKTFKVHRRLSSPWPIQPYLFQANMHNLAWNGPFFT